MLEAKFKVGQRVFAVSNKSDSRQVHVKCDVCNSTGKVKVEGREEEYVCPACHGRTETEHYGYKYVISYDGATIGKVEIQEYAPKYKSRYKSEVRYMLEETGVGSGMVWREDRLFGTYDEAKEFCEKYISSDYYDEKAILREEYNVEKS